jgi:hypothetical protein
MTLQVLGAAVRQPSAVAQVGARSQGRRQPVAKNLIDLHLADEMTELPDWWRVS